MRFCRSLYACLVTLVVLILSSCSQFSGELPEYNTEIGISGIKNCDGSPVDIDANKPITVIVHGCFSSATKFRALADTYTEHGEQVVCFEYDDRRSLDEVSGDLIVAINMLSNIVVEQSINIVGHSQGGLISRRALIEDRQDYLTVQHKSLSLITVSAPFNGIDAANHCGIDMLRVASLGLVDVICYLATGDKYRQITSSSDFINNPGKLVPAVQSHLVVKTREENTCRVFENGKCIEDDYVFSLEEQTKKNIEDDQRAHVVTMNAGHVEIVGSELTTPQKLVRLFQEQGVLALRIEKE